MEIEKLIFKNEKTSSDVILADVAKETEEKILVALEDKTEIPKDDYIGIVAKILFFKFGSRREDLYDEYLVCEGVAMAIGVKGLPNGRFPPFKEDYFRQEIRGAINDLEEESKK